MNARKQDQRLADKTRRAALLLLVATGSLLFASSDAQAGYAISRILDGLKFKPGKYFLPGNKAPGSIIKLHFQWLPQGQGVIRRIN